MSLSVTLSALVRPKRQNTECQPATSSMQSCLIFHNQRLNAARGNRNPHVIRTTKICHFATSHPNPHSVPHSTLARLPAISATSTDLDCEQPLPLLLCSGGMTCRNQNSTRLLLPSRPASARLLAICGDVPSQVRHEAPDVGHARVDHQGRLKRRQRLLIARHLQQAQPKPRRRAEVVRLQSREEVRGGQSGCWESMVSHRDVSGVNDMDRTQLLLRQQNEYRTPLHRWSQHRAHTPHTCMPSTALQSSMLAWWRPMR